MPFFIIIVFSIILLNVRLRYLNKNYDANHDKQKLLRDDFESNFARAREIDPEMFVRFSEKSLPFRDDYNKDEYPGSEILKIQEKVKKHLGMPIIITDNRTNTELKKNYGAANLQTIIAGEENFTRLMQRLNQWAKLLNEAGNIQDAETVLCAAVSSRSDISETYILLYDIYAASRRAEKIAELKKAVDNLPEIAKIIVERYITEAESKETL